MPVKDILGFGKVLPIDKLLDIVSKAVGRISKSYFDRKNIDNKAYEIKKIAEARAEEMKIISKAVKENFKLTGGIEYKEEKLVISSPKEIPKEIPQEIQSKILITPPIEERAQERINYQESKKQLNIESITGFAFEELKNEEPINNEPLDEDWTTRFFRIAEDISNEEMQAIWGKILAGEIKHPKSYTLRTLELIRNLTKEEANLFIKVANFAITSNDISFIFNGYNDEVKNNFNIQYRDIAHLIEVGILQAGEFITWQLFKTEKDSQTIFTSGNIVIIVTKKAESPLVQLPITIFTHSGKELLKLISATPSFEYLTTFARSIKQDNIEVKYAHIEWTTATQVSYADPLQDFPTT